MVDLDVIWWIPILTEKIELNLVTAVLCKLQHFKVGFFILEKRQNTCIQANKSYQNFHLSFFFFN